MDLLHNDEHFCECPTCSSIIETAGQQEAGSAPNQVFLNKSVRSVVRFPLFYRSMVLPAYLSCHSLLTLPRRRFTGKAMAPAQISHYQTYRYGCRGCRMDFCSSCRLVPYHFGFTCQEFETYNASPKCRFCGDAVVKGVSKYANPRKLPAVDEVCGSKDCVAAAETICEKKLACGHWCPGIKGEEKCPPCLHGDCPGFNPDVASCDAEDKCGICMSDALQAAPVALLQCTHGFHLKCVKQRLGLKWPGARIEFSFISCPLCKQLMKHPQLDAEIRPALVFERSVNELALISLEVEGMANHDDIITEGSPFFKRPLEFAMNYFMFYQCAVCTKPYFAGARHCAAAGDEGGPINRADLVCTKCQVLPPESECKIHGTEYVGFKCRYCCSPAVWYCFASIH